MKRKKKESDGRISNDQTRVRRNHISISSGSLDGVSWQVATQLVAQLQRWRGKTPIPQITDQSIGESAVRSAGSRNAWLALLLRFAVLLRVRGSSQKEGYLTAAVATAFGEYLLEHPSPMTIRCALLVSSRKKDC
jgi:hypothetical protein